MGRGRLLVAEDAPAVREATVSLLQFLGYEVIAVADGHQALEQFRKHAPELDAIMLDLTMPELDGRQTLEQVRQSDPEIPVLLVSGYDELELGELGEWGASAFLHKPYRLHQLAELVPSDGRSS